MFQVPSNFNSTLKYGDNSHSETKQNILSVTFTVSTTCKRKWKQEPSCALANFPITSKNKTFSQILLREVDDEKCPAIVCVCITSERQSNLNNLRSAIYILLRFLNRTFYLFHHHHKSVRMSTAANDSDVR